MSELYTENIEQLFSDLHKFYKKKYKNDDKKVFECTPDIFKNICEIEQRRSKRTKNNIFVVEYKLFPQKKETNKKLLQTLYQNLFETDIITKIKLGYYLQLVVDVSLANLKKIIMDIKSDFNNKNSNAETVLSCNYEKIN